MFDDVFSPSPKAAKCLDDVGNTPHYGNGHPFHVHCARDGAVVYIEQSGPGPRDFDVDPLEGGVCHGEVFCSDCMTNNTPTGERMCRDCAESAANAFFKKNQLQERAVRAQNELQELLDRLKVEPDAALIRATVNNVDAIIDLVEKIHSQLLPNIDRAKASELAA